MTLRPREVVVVGVVKMGLGVVKGFGLLRIRILGIAAFEFLIMMW